MSASAAVTPETSYLFCRDLAARHYENFPVITRFLTGAQRDQLCAAYAFMRTADDMADSGTFSLEQRLQLLLQWQARLDAAYAGEADEPIFVALADTVRKAGIPKEYFDALLNAFKVDLFKFRYRTFDELLEYCRYSANPVGRIVLHVMGYGESPDWPRMAAASDDLCTALQLVNHLQDLFADRESKRLYLPAEDLNRFGYTAEDWERGEVNGSFRALMAFEVERVVDYFQRGEVLMAHLRPNHRRQIRLIWLGGRRIADKIIRHRYDVLHHRPVITGYDKIRIALKFLIS